MKVFGFGKDEGSHRIEQTRSRKINSINLCLSYSLFPKVTLPKQILTEEWDTSHKIAHSKISTDNAEIMKLAGQLSEHLSVLEKWSPPTLSLDDEMEWGDHQIHLEIHLFPPPSTDWNCSFRKENWRIVAFSLSPQRQLTGIPWLMVLKATERSDRTRKIT